MAPGHFDTRMGRDLTPRSTRTIQTGCSGRCPRRCRYGKRYGTAAEVANVVLWLFSDESEYVSGALHLIDGALNAG